MNKKIRNLICFVVFNVLILGSCSQQNDSYLKLTDKSISNIVDGIKYEAGDWPHPDYGKPFKSLGNHRFVIKSQKFS